MRMIFSFFTLLFLSISIYNCFGQEGFLKGEITDIEGQLTSGEIEYGYWLQTPAAINFKQADGVVKAYGPKNIRSFKVYLPNGVEEIYSSFNVDIDYSPLDVKRLDSNPKPDLVNATIFLRHLVNGTINLYELVDSNNKRHYYVAKGEDSPKALTYRKYYYLEGGPDVSYTNLKTSTGVAQIKTNDAYKNELYNLMADKGPVKKSKFENLPYKESVFVELISAYNGESSYVRSKEKTVVSFELKTGLALIKHIPIDGESAGKKVSPTYVVGINLTIPRTRWSVQNDFRFFNYRQNNKIEQSIENYEIVEQDFTYLKLQTMFRYTYNTAGQAKIYFQGGVLNGYLSKVNSTSTRYFHGSESVTRMDENLKRLESGIIYGAGVQIKKIFAGIDKEVSNGYQFSIFDPTFKNLYVTLGYRF